MVSLHVLISLPQTMRYRSFEVKCMCQFNQNLLFIASAQQHSDHVNFNIFTLNVKYLAKNSLHTTLSGHLRNYDCNQLNSE